MNSIDLNVYDDLKSKVDGSSNQIVLSWNVEEPLLINTDLKVCQQCGSGLSLLKEDDIDKDKCPKSCDRCGWSVTKNGFPALVKLDHQYPTSEIDVDGFGAEQSRLDRASHMMRQSSPDLTNRIADGEGLDLDSNVDVDVDVNVEGFDVGLTMNVGRTEAGISMNLGAVLALAIFAYRMAMLKDKISPVQVVLELCMACFLSWVYIVVAVYLIWAESQGKEGN